MRQTIRSKPPQRQENLRDEEKDALKRFRSDQQAIEKIEELQKKEWLRS
jgi:hypothetical protein